MEQIERIKHMEKCLDRAAEAVMELSAALKKYAEAQEAIRELKDYLGSEEWKADFEADEEKRLPQDLKRGVLSEDGIWNMLEDVQQMNSRMLKVVENGR
ncbi:MAG: DUF4298 domain-containing protein [Bacteroidaceae bacterium]|nr:DUF4298 domain-containing protein [Bacteroidaceae bacterium]